MDALGGRDDVLAAVRRDESALKAAYRKRVFPSQWFGPLAAIGASMKPSVMVPLPLFGSSAVECWPDVVLAPVPEREADAA